MWKKLLRVHATKVYQCNVLRPKLFDIKRGSKVRNYLLNYKIRICSQEYEVHITIQKNNPNYVPEL